MLIGQVGEVLVTARRKGRDWYLGGMSAVQPRDLEIPLGFLGKGSFEAEIWKDANDTDKDPNHLVHTRSRVSSGDQLRIRVALDGGFVAKLSWSR